MIRTVLSDEKSQRQLIAKLHIVTKRINQLFIYVYVQFKRQLAISLLLSQNVYYAYFENSVKTLLIGSKTSQGAIFTDTFCWSKLSFLWTKCPILKGVRLHKVDLHLADYPRPVLNYISTLCFPFLLPEENSRAKTTFVFTWFCVPAFTFCESKKRALK